MSPTRPRPRMFNRPILRRDDRPREGGSTPRPAASLAPKTRGLPSGIGFVWRGRSEDQGRGCLSPDRNWLRSVSGTGRWLRSARPVSRSQTFRNRPIPNQRRRLASFRQKLRRPHGSETFHPRLLLPRVADFGIGFVSSPGSGVGFGRRDPSRRLRNWLRFVTAPAIGFVWSDAAGRWVRSARTRRRVEPLALTPIPLNGRAAKLPLLVTTLCVVTLPGRSAASSRQQGRRGRGASAEA
jgi:hypothetical protein